MKLESVCGFLFLSFFFNICLSIFIYYIFIYFIIRILFELYLNNKDFLYTDFFSRSMYFHSTQVRTVSLLI